LKKLIRTHFLYVPQRHPAVKLIVYPLIPD